MNLGLVVQGVRLIAWYLSCAILLVGGSVVSSAQEVQRVEDSSILTIKAKDRAFRVAVPKDHPRLYLRPSDLERLRAKRSDPMFVMEWPNIKFGQIEPISNALHSLIEPGSIDPVTKLDKCDLAIVQALALLERAPDDDANLDFLFLQGFHRAAIVYDWCYGKITANQRVAFVQQFKRLAKAKGSPGYPAPRNSPALVGHEAQGALLGNQLAAGLAIFDEDPTMFTAAATVVLTEYRSAAEFLFPGVSDLQGIYYARHDHFITASWLFRTLGVYDAFSPSLAKMPYEWLYSLRSDGRMLRSGDLVDDNNISKMYRFTFSSIGAYYGDPLLVWMGESDNRDRAISEWRATKWAQFMPLTADMYALRFIFLDSKLRRQALAEGRRRLEQLPLVLYAPTPAGRMIFRTGWSSITDGMQSRDAIVDMKIGEYFIGNHQRKDFGTFQVYFKGPLAISSGVYQGDRSSWYGGDHWANYYHQTVSSNGLLVFDPAERQFLYGDRANDGGQIWPNEGKDHPRNVEEILDVRNGYRMGVVTAHSIGEHGDYGYIAGDISAAYSRSKASQLQRSMIAIKGDEATVPAVVVIRDHLRSSNANFEKAFVLHSVDRPLVEGRTITVTNTRHSYDQPLNRGKFSGVYGGKLVLQSLFPDRVSIRLVDGQRVGDRDFSASKPQANGEEGWGRAEIVSSGNLETDFLSVMFVTDAVSGTSTSAAKVTTDDFLGCEILDKTVLFGRAQSLLRQEARFSLSTRWLFVGGVAPGRWELSRSDGAKIDVRVTSEAKSFREVDLSPGSYTLRPRTLDAIVQ